MAYSYKRAITIDYTKCGASNSTDFPVLISGTYSYLATVANGGLVQNSSGYDIAFYSDLALTTPLYWEIERYIATTGEVIFWVKIPTVSYTVDTVIYMAYGDAGIATFQSTATSVWNSNFQGVYHLPDGTTLNVNDSTSNANNGTNNGATAGVGKIDGGAVNTTAQYIDLTDLGALDGASAFTISGWVNPTTLADLKGIFSKYSPADGKGIVIQTGLAAVGGSNNTDLLFSVQNAGVNAYIYTNTHGLLANGSWTYITAVFDGSLSSANRLKLYSNGALQTTTLSGTPPTTTDTTSYVSKVGRVGDDTRTIALTTDEWRVMSVANGVDWILTEYNNQNSPSTFYSVGSQISASNQTNFFRMF